MMMNRGEDKGDGDDDEQGEDKGDGDDDEQGWDKGDDDEQGEKTKVRKVFWKPLE